MVSTYMYNYVERFSGKPPKGGSLRRPLRNTHGEGQRGRPTGKASGEGQRGRPAGKAGGEGRRGILKKIIENVLFTRLKNTYNDA